MQIRIFISTLVEFVKLHQAEAVQLSRQLHPGSEVAPGGGGQLGGGLQPPQGDPRGVRWHRQSEVLDCGYSHLLPVMWNPVIETFCE